MSIPFNSIVNSLPDTIPFIGPETLERKAGKTFQARLGANESAFGISSKARDAIVDAISSQGCSWYGDPENHVLRELLSEFHEIGMNNICVDAGIDSLLGLTIRMFIEPGDVVVSSIGAYPTVEYHAKGLGAQLQRVPYKGNYEDPLALVNAAREHNARLIYLANPDNPMGTCLGSDAISDMIDSLPVNCILMLDEAYIEFMNGTPTLPLQCNDKRVIRFRTFSKAYGLAGMRIGYAMAHEDIIAGYNRIRNHFGVNRLAQAAAIASIQDQSFIQHVVKLVNNGRQRIYDLADELSLNYLPSATNFVAVDMGSRSHADALVLQLAEKGVFIRKPNMDPQNRYIRIGVGTEQEHEYLTQTLSTLLSG